MEDRYQIATQEKGLSYITNIIGESGSFCLSETSTTCFITANDRSLLRRNPLYDIVWELQEFTRPLTFFTKNRTSYGQVRDQNLKAIKFNTSPILAKRIKGYSKIAESKPRKGEFAKDIGIVRLAYNWELFKTYLQHYPFQPKIYHIMYNAGEY